jgi:hypothetical protein
MLGTFGDIRRGRSVVRHMPPALAATADSTRLSRSTAEEIGAWQTN